MSVKVYGASDDLIEVEGDVSEEFSAPRDERAVLGFSTGQVVGIQYDKDGCWRIHPLGGSGIEIVHAGGPDAEEREDGTPGYSDVATIPGTVTWVVLGTEWAR